MTALVLGSTGLVGSHVRAELERRGLETVGTSTIGAGTDYALDLTDSSAIDALVGQLKPELIMHAAGVSSLARAWEEPARAFAVNTAGQLHLLEAIRNRAPEAHLVFISSAAVYGPPEADQSPFGEDSPLRPASPYAASKAAAEILCGQYEREHRTSISTARIFNQVGPGQSVDQAPSEFAQAIAIAEAAGQRQVNLPVGNPLAERDFTDVRDTARALVDLGTDRRAGTFNICSGRARSLEEIVRLLGEASRLEVSVSINTDHDRPADVQRIVGSPARLEAATGWKAGIPLGESLAELLADWRMGRVRPHED